MTESDHADQTSALRPRLHLDELLSQLQEQVSAAIAVRDRVYRLLDAVVSIGSNLELGEVLRRIVRAAVELVDARYGAMGLLNENREGLTEFVYEGMDTETADRIGHRPEGHGILGVLIHDPRPLRLRDLSAHPEAAGFPPGHPPMRSFLGVPVRLRGAVFANLYLTEKRSGQEFDETDESLLQTLAAAAGVAIENALLFEDTKLGEAWREASSEVVTALLSGTDRYDVLSLVATHARELADARQAVILLPDPDEPKLRVVAAAGQDSARLAGVTVSLNASSAGVVYSSGEPEAWESSAEVAGSLTDYAPIGPRLAVPMGKTGLTRGVLVVYNENGAPPFRTAVLDTLAAFAGQTAVAIEVSDRRLDAERLSLYEDRDRIARNLHDLVIQRLFATGMSIQSATRMLEVNRATATSRLERAVDDIDTTIREIRSTIFGLQQPVDPGRGLRARVLAIAAEQAPALGFDPAVQFSGLVDTVVPPEMSQHVVAVVREALANVAKDAQARTASVSLAVGKTVLLEIRDNGVGLPAGGRRSGLASLAARAEELGGSFDASGDRTGTTVRWEVPLPSPGPA